MQIGIIGTGRIGGTITRKLIAAGHDVSAMTHSANYDFPDALA